MRLIKLSANKSTFRTVEFNRIGISFVIGSKKSRDDSLRNRTNTYNGVGKSLMIELIHYCLGSNANDAFKQHLPTWEFSLAIEVDGVGHVITRSAGKPTDIRLDGEPISLKALRDWLLAISFESAPIMKGLSFRSLLSPFIRAGRGAYERFDRANEGDGMDPYSAMLRSAFLLGLDLDLAQRKQELRVRQVTLKKTMKELESDPLFADLLADDKAGIELTALREEEARLDTDLQQFTVAENYQSIQKDANALKRDTEASRRELVKVTDAIAQIDRSLETKGDLDPAVVARLYAEAQAALPDRVLKQLDEVIAFQRELQQRRVFRLTSERQKLERSRSELAVRVGQLSLELEEAIRYLGSHVAMDEYLAVNQRLNEIRQEIARLEASKAQREKVTREIKMIDLDLVTESIRADDYLASVKPLNDEATNVFRRFTRLLYGNRASGLSISNDGGDTKLRYKIEAHINSDAAEGINEAKIFCYDLMIMTLKRGHSIEFLIHDSTLFHPIDHRQRWSMLLLVDSVCKQLGIQYIAMLNEHDVSSMTPVQADERALFDELFSPQRVVLRLTDEAANGRLLGVEVDMNYREKSQSRPVEDPTG